MDTRPTLHELATRTPVTEDDARETLAACLILEEFADIAADEEAGCDWSLFAIGTEGQDRPFCVGCSRDPYAQFLAYLRDARSPDRRDRSPVAARLHAEMPPGGRGVWLETLQSGMTVQQAREAERALVRQLYRSGVPVLGQGGPAC